jgi:hypothetical protein
VTNDFSRSCHRSTVANDASSQDIFVVRVNSTELDEEEARENRKLALLHHWYDVGCHNELSYHFGSVDARVYSINVLEPDREPRQCSKEVPFSGMIAARK